MSKRAGDSDIRAEVESILEDYGLMSIAGEALLSTANASRIREMALSIIYGDVDNEELAHSGNLYVELGLMVQKLMAMRNSPSVRNLEELNPYYSAFQPKVIRDR